MVIVFGQLKRRVFWWNNSLPFRPLWWGQRSAIWLPIRKKGQTKLISNPNSQIPQQYRIQLPFRVFVRSRGLNNCAMYFLLFNWGGQIRLCQWFMDDWGSTCLRGWLVKVSRFAEDYQVLFCFWNGLRHQGCEFTGWRWCPWWSTLFSFFPKWVHPPIPQVACVMNGFLLDQHQAIGVSNWPTLTMHAIFLVHVAALQRCTSRRMASRPVKTGDLHFVTLVIFSVSVRGKSCNHYFDSSNLIKAEFKPNIENTMTKMEVRTASDEPMSLGAKAAVVGCQNHLYTHCDRHFGVDQASCFISYVHLKRSISISTFCICHNSLFHSTVIGICCPKLARLA